MVKFKIVFKKSTIKEINKIPSDYLKKILFKIKNLATNPKPIGYSKLTNKELFRIRVGKYRILYEIKINLLTIIVVKVGHRKDVYS